jgi:hypothetical protein
MLIAGALGPHTALNTLVSSTVASAVMCGLTLYWVAWSSARSGGGASGVHEPCSVGLVSVWKACSYGAGVYSAVALLVASASPPDGWLPRGALPVALGAGWCVIALVGIVCYVCWRARHPLPPPVAPLLPPLRPALEDTTLPYGDMNTVAGFDCCEWTLARAAGARGGAGGV